MGAFRVEASLTATQSDRIANRKGSSSRRVCSAEAAADNPAANHSHDNRSASPFGSDRQRPQLGLLCGSSLQAKRALSWPGRAGSPKTPSAMRR
jgi:hypothetical protein